MNRLTCAIKLLATIIPFKVSRQATDYWSWLFALTADAKSHRFHDKCFIAFLLRDAYARSDYAAACKVYEEFFDYMINNGFSDKSINILLHCARRANRDDIAADIAAKLNNLD